MDRREFLSTAAAGIVGAGLLGAGLTGCAGKDRKYSVVILGDTHFDTEPADVYHSNYNEPVEWLNRVQRAEFARNGEMWRERCPRLVSRAAELVGPDTKMVFQMGDLIQGDCGSGVVHRKMLDDVMNRFKDDFGGLPFITVVGNHDIRGVDAEQAYKDYMPARMSRELGKPVSKTTFSFNIGDDVYIVADFNTPDDEEMEKLLKDSEGARHTFVIVHGPLFPYDSSSCRWFYHGSVRDTEIRRHFRREFARRNVIGLCGHTHRTEFFDWVGDGGRITQLTMNSVWTTNEKTGIYEIDSEGAAKYGTLRIGTKNDDGTPVADETALFDEYRDGLRAYSRSRAAGSYKLTVTPKNVAIDFYAGASQELSERFVLR